MIEWERWTPGGYRPPGAPQMCFVHQWSTTQYQSIGQNIITKSHNYFSNLDYNYERYPLSPPKTRFLVLIEQYLPHISDPVYSVHQSFMWFLWLNWRKSTFYPFTAHNDSKFWPIVTSSIQEPAASNCDVTMTDCSHVVAMDAFLAQWNRKFITAQWSTENTSSFNFFVYFFFKFYDPRVSTWGIESFS